MGRTNGWDWHVSKNGIHNKFIPEAKVGGLDFGASLVYSFYWKLIDIKIPMNISLNATRRGIYAGMMLEFYPVW
ncbi:hypothetical protein [Porphyromonas gingivicanis]|uniref:hypothetical protein n=1 Tax=Porphyromonas gingivicanis TaxID=266762 RepID=UPI001269F821|nr:hypothetical protein [Porphyromonas gingivicanis]